MQITPQEFISENDLKKGMSLVVKDGLATEIMTALSGGTFLVAVAIFLGASNFQIGLLAALPTFMNIFQLLSIWLVRKYKNRRAISVICSLLARIPLVFVGALPLLFPSLANIQLFLFFLSFYYFFASVSGPSWNSWMKDLIPENKLGAFFARRTMISQTVNVVLSILLAVLIDYIKKYLPAKEQEVYSYMFMMAGFIGIIGTFFLYQTPEPQSHLSKENLLRLLRQPLKNKNFRNLLIFNSAWVFAINIATPFFTVYMLKTIGLPVSYVVALTIITQVSSILTVRLWGRFSDRYSNKTIIAIGAPLYILCIIAWCFAGLFNTISSNIILIAVINLATGIATSGINLSLINIGLKLAPKEDTIVYLSTKNIITAFFSSMAPLLGGYLADFFGNRHIDINAQYEGPRLVKHFHLLSLHQWNFLFVIGAFLAFIAIQFLGKVKEEGEVEKDVVVRILRSSIKNSMKDYFILGTLIEWKDQVSTRISRIFNQP